MSDDPDSRAEIVRRLFYLVTVAAEDAAALAVEGQAPGLDRLRLAEIAARLRALGEMIEILAPAVEAIVDEAGAA